MQLITAAPVWMIHSFLQCLVLLEVLLVETRLLNRSTVSPTSSSCKHQAQSGKLLVLAS